MNRPSLPADPANPTTPIVGRLTLLARIALKILVRERIQHESSVLSPGDFAERVTARTRAVLEKLQESGDLTYSTTTGPTMRDRVDAALNHASDVTGAFQSRNSPPPSPDLEVRQTLAPLDAYRVPALIYARDPVLPWAGYEALHVQLISLLSCATYRAAHLVQVPERLAGTPDALEVRGSYDATLQKQLDSVMAAVADLVRGAAAPAAPALNMLTRFVDQPRGVKFTGTPPEDPSHDPTGQLGRVTLGPGQRETVFGVDIAAGPDGHVEAVFDPSTSPPTLVRLTRSFSTPGTEVPPPPAASSAPTPDETSRAPAGRVGAESELGLSEDDADLLGRFVVALDMAGFARAGLGLAPEGSEKALQVERTHRILSDGADRVFRELRDRLAGPVPTPQVPDDAVASSLDLLRAELVATSLPQVEGLSPSAQALLTAAVRDVVGVATERALALACGWPASLDRETSEGREYLRTEGQLPRMLSHLAEVVSRFTDYEADRDGGAAPGVGLLDPHELPQCPALGEAENARLAAATEALVVVVGERAATAATLPEGSASQGASPDAPGRRLLTLREAAVRCALLGLAEAVADVVSNVQSEAVRAAGRSTVDLLRVVVPPARTETEADQHRVARGVLAVARVNVPDVTAAVPKPQDEPDPEHTLPTDAPLAECGGSWLLTLLMNMMDESATLVLNNQSTPGYLNRVSADIDAVQKELRKRVEGFPVTPHRTYARIEPNTTLSDLTDKNLVDLTLQLCQDSTLSRATPTGEIGDPTETSVDFGRASAELYIRIAQRTFNQEPAPTPSPSPSWVHLPHSQYAELLNAALGLTALTAPAPDVDAAVHKLLVTVRRLRNPDEMGQGLNPATWAPSASDPARTETVTVGDLTTFVRDTLARKAHVATPYGEFRPGQTRVRTEGPPERTTVHLADELFRRVHHLDELMPPDRDESFVEMQNSVTGLKSCIDELVLQARVEADGASRCDGVPLFESQLGRIVELAERLDMEVPIGQEYLGIQRACDALTDYLEKLRSEAVADEATRPDPDTVRALARDDLLNLRLLATVILDGFPRGTDWESTRRRAENNHHDLVTKIDQMITALPTGEA